MKKDNEEIVQYTLRLPIELHTRFKSALAAERKSMSNELIEYIISYLAKKDYEKKSNQKKK